MAAAKTQRPVTSNVASCLLDIFWLNDDSLPEPDVLAAEIVENLEAALEQFRSVTLELVGDEDA